MLIWVDDFGRYGATETLMTDALYAQVAAGANAWNLDTTNPRTGARAFRLGPNPGGLKLWRRIFGAAKTSVGVGAAFFMPELPFKEGIVGPPIYHTALVLFEFRDAANFGQFTLICGTDGGIQAYRNLNIADNDGVGVSIANDATDIGRSAPCIFANGWNQIQVFATASATSGSIEVRCNGATVLTISGVPTVATGNVEYSQVVCGTANGVGSPFADSATAVDIADVHAWDSTGSYNNDFPGDNKAFLCMPNGDSGPSDWSRSSGAQNFAMIDEIPPDEASSYLTTLIATDQVQVETEDLPIPAVAVSGVIGWFRGRKTDAGACSVKIGVVSNGITEWGDDHILTTAYMYFESVFETDPDTSLPWTTAAVDAAKIIYERTV